MDFSKLCAELERDEGLRLKPYLDNAVPPKLTIGIGRNLTDRGIGRDEAFLMLHNDVDGAVADLDQRLPWWRRLVEVRQRVLVNMCFNMGISRLLGFHDALARMQAGDYAGAATAMLDSAWARQVGDRPAEPGRPEGRAHRLAGMMRTGVEPA